MKNRLFGIMSAVMIAAASVPVTDASAWLFLQEEQQGVFINREYTNESQIGTKSFMPSDTGCFSVIWDGVQSYGAEQARKFDRELNWDQYSKITQTYEADVTATGNTYIAVHGWTQNRLAEYYVVEDWGSFRPDWLSSKGFVEIDGKKYQLFVRRRYNEPGVEGVEFFDQFWSVRLDSGYESGKPSHIENTVDLAAHFRAWSEKGVFTGQVCPETCGIYVDIYGGDEGNTAGSVEISNNEFSYEYVTPPVTTEPAPTTTDPAAVTTAAVGTGETPQTVTTAIASEKIAADENGVFKAFDFEENTDFWSPRVFPEDADAESENEFIDRSKLELSDTYYAGGEKSLFVSDRIATWVGAELSLEPFALQNGTDYQIRAAVMQNSESMETIRLVLEYTDDFGELQFIPIADKKCRKGEWNTVGGLFTFPALPEVSDDPHQTVAPPKDVRIFVETEDTCCDYYLDSVTLAEKDAAVTVDLSAANPAPKPAVEPKLVQYPERDNSEPYRAHQNKDYSFMSGGEGFKDIFGPYFRIGATASAIELQDEETRAFYLKHFNSITCENELKPEAILKSIGTDDVTVDLSQADTILKFAEENGIGLRGHNFIWYSQTPAKMFAGTPEESDARIESMIRQTFDQLKTNYPELKLYAYDVCNEVFKMDGGGLRIGGENALFSDKSGWADVYGNDNHSFIINAFKWARKYAPVDCKLYLSDFNEYMPAKCEDICDLAKTIMAEGDYIDGISMQSHLDTDYPDPLLYESALKKFAALGLDVQITELEIKNSHSDPDVQRAMWSDIFRIAMNYADNISSVTMFEPLGSKWRWTLRPYQNSLFKANMEPVPAYYDILDLTDEIAPPVMADVPIAKPAKPAGYQPLASKKTAAAAGVTLRGDVDCSGTVDVSDVVLLMRFAVEDQEAKLTDQGIANGDVDGNGKTDSNDGTVILKFIAKQIRQL